MKPLLHILQQLIANYFFDGDVKAAEAIPEQEEADLYYLFMSGYLLCHQHIVKEQKLNEVESAIQQYVQTLTPNND